MLKKRVIPVLLLRDGYLVQSKGFCRYRNLGNALWAVRRMSEWGADELIYLDITGDGVHDARRDDLAHGNPATIAEILQQMSAFAFMPVTVGGGIETLEDIEQRLEWGADKVSVNTLLITHPERVGEAAKEFGSQCIVASIDSAPVGGTPVAHTHGGKNVTGVDTVRWARRAEELGVGEILLNSIDRDGRQNGFDVALVDGVSAAVDVPVIALGGAGDWFDFEEVLTETRASAVAAANLFHHRDQSVFLAKQYLFERGHVVRKPELHIL